MTSKTNLEQAVEQFEKDFFEKNADFKTSHTEGVEKIGYTFTTNEGLVITVTTQRASKVLGKSKMTIKDDILEQKMLEKDICFVSHEQNDTCECNNPLTYGQPKDVAAYSWVKITCVDDMPIDEGFVLLKHENGDILVGQYVFDTSPLTVTTEFYQSQDYEWLADLDDIVAWCKIPYGWDLPE